jgi:hypothetical protein
VRHPESETEPTDAIIHRKDLEIQSNPTFLGPTEARTMINIGLGSNLRARRISDFSFHLAKAEPFSLPDPPACKILIILRPFSLLNMSPTRVCVS